MRLEVLAFSIMAAMVLLVAARELWFRIDMWRNPAQSELELHRLRMMANDPAGSNSVEEDLGEITSHRLRWDSALDRRETFDHAIGGLGVVWIGVALITLLAS